MEPTIFDKKFEIFHVLGIRWETVRIMELDELDYLYNRAGIIRRQILVSKENAIKDINNQNQNQ